MASGDHQKSCASNILVLIKMHYSYYQDFLYLIKGIQLTGHYSNLKNWDPYT